MKSLIVNDLCIEVTRRCNMKCSHCMRGDAQNINLNIDVINKLFNNKEFEIKKINRLSITGGEPTLNAVAILKIIREILNKKIKINSFVMVINGSIYNIDLVKGLNLLYKYYLDNEDKNQFELICSRDQFHIYQKADVLSKYNELPYFINNEIIINNNQILCLGRAYKNKIGNISTYYIYKTFFYKNIENNYPIIHSFSNGKFSLEKLYLSSKGLYGFQIMDATYDMVDELCIYNQDKMEEFLSQSKVKRRN